MKKEEKIKIIEDLINQYPIFQAKNLSKVEVISSGSLSLDLALGIGGYPKGSIIDIYGNEGTGKSLISLMAIKEAQKSGHICLLVDAERNYSKSADWLEKNGINLDELLIFYPSSGEETFDYLYKILSTKKINLVVVDSVPALIPQECLEKDLDESTSIGIHGRMMSKALQKLIPLVDSTKSIIIFINQMRAKITPTPFEEPYEATGGLALRFYASIRIKTLKVKQSEVKKGEEIIGHKVKCYIVKNKVAKPFTMAEFTILYQGGIDNISELSDLLIQNGIVKQQNAWFMYKDKKFQGFEALKKFVSENYENLKNEFLNVIKSK